MTDKKLNFIDAIKAAQANKSRVPQATAKAVQQAKVKNQVNSNKPATRQTGRGR